jgi:dTDP-4-amino-4,6-dideoxygalactose transaminase
LNPESSVKLPSEKTVADWAAANVALHLGAKPVFTEVDPVTWCMTANDLERCFSSRTKAIVPAHT